VADVQFMGWHFLLNLLHEPVSSVTSIGSELESFRMLHVADYLVQGVLVELFLCVSLDSVYRVSVYHKLLLSIIGGDHLLARSRTH
jgi:hypothetical protein